MLVLSRYLGQSITIGDNIKVTIVDIVGDKIKIGIEAPRYIPVHRQEVAELISQQSNLPNQAKKPKSAE